MMLIDMKTKTMDYNEKLISYIQNQKKDYVNIQFNRIDQVTFEEKYARVENQLLR